MGWHIVWARGTPLDIVVVDGEPSREWVAGVVFGDAGADVGNKFR